MGWEDDTVLEVYKWQIVNVATEYLHDVKVS